MAKVKDDGLGWQDYSCRQDMQVSEFKQKVAAIEDWDKGEAIEIAFKYLKSVSSERHITSKICLKLLELADEVMVM